MKWSEQPWTAYCPSHKRELLSRFVETSVVLNVMLLAARASQGLLFRHILLFYCPEISGWGTGGRVEIKPALSSKPRILHGSSCTWRKKEDSFSNSFKGFIYSWSHGLIRRETLLLIHRKALYLLAMPSFSFKQRKASYTREWVYTESPELKFLRGIMTVTVNL